jgi:rare lipoprotein A
VRVVNLENGRSTVVKINDRGPFVDGRIIDLSRAAAEELGMLAQGVARVRIEVLDFARDNDLFCIQAGSYSLQGNAENAGRRIEQAGFAVSFERNPLGMIRVLVRGIEEKKIPEAERRLESLGFGNLVVRREAEVREASAR